MKFQRNEYAKRYHYGSRFILYISIPDLGYSIGDKFGMVNFYCKMAGHIRVQEARFFEALCILCLGFLEACEW